MPKQAAAEKPVAVAVTHPEVLSAQQEIAKLQARIDQLSRPPFVEFPKAVRRHNKPGADERIFQSRAEQDAAGPDWADPA